MYNILLLMYIRLKIYLILLMIDVMLIYNVLLIDINDELIDGDLC